MKYPIAAFFLIVTEFCERFTYYGIRSKFFLVTFLQKSERLKKSLAHNEMKFPLTFLSVFIRIVYDKFGNQES